MSAAQRHPLGIAGALGLLAIAVAAALINGPLAVATTAVTSIGAVILAVALVEVRPIVAVSVVLGTVAGAVIGRSIVRVLCLPGSCRTAETLAGSVTAVGALFGVGLVVALVIRSFDEYRAAVAAGRPPPSPGCETDQDPIE